MPKNIAEERLRWILPIINKEMSIRNVAKVCPYSERSLKRWLKAYRERGFEGLIPTSTRPKTQPNETPIRIKEEVITSRKRTRLCAKKLHWRLKKQDLIVPVSTIGKILKDAKLIRKYRTKKVKYKYIRAERRPGELIEIDVKYVPCPVQGEQYYQYTAIDTASRWRYLKIYEEQITGSSMAFLGEVVRRFPFPVQGVKTDNHATFTNYYTGSNRRSDLTVKRLHPFDVLCGELGIVHYLIDPGKPAQNGTVERSHRTDQETFYDHASFASLADLRCKLRRWNKEYNNLEHCSLGGKTPIEMVDSKVPKVLS